MYADRQIYKLFKCRATARKLADFVTYDRRVDSPAFPRIFFYSEKVSLDPFLGTYDLELQRQRCKNLQHNF
jgi:hypothetical protein